MFKSKMRAGMCAIVIALVGFFPLAQALAVTSGSIGILDTLSKRNRPVYFVHIFDGDFPIPVRFELFPHGREGSNELDFKSASLPLINSYNNSAFKNENIGFIKIGNSADYVKKHLALNPNFPESKKSFECYGLNVLVRRPLNQNPGATNFSDAFIYRGSQYIEISGNDIELWSELLKVYGSLAKEHAGSDCPIPTKKGKSGINGVRLD
jgi:hypothetical protein